MKETERIYFLGRVVLYLFLVIWGLRFIAGHPNAPVVLYSFMHNVNLPIHEAGHVVFGPFGWFIGVLGGSLMQLLVPLAFVLAFLLKYRNLYAASVTLWWLAQNFMDIAPYIDDARAQRLILLGGITGRDAPGYHDWNNILGHLGWLEHDHLIAQISYDIGRFLMVVMIVFGAWVLITQFRALHAEPEATPEVDQPLIGSEAAHEEGEGGTGLPGGED